PHGVSFDDVAIGSRCEAMQSDLPGGRDAHMGRYRFMFINATILTVLRLTYRVERVAFERRTTRTWP
ncbi:MAG: hypothetical protein JWM38_2147, partial [Sphingomonas bacterium]|nr:hypothetical protein [Sphingomonas bacterium]